MNQPQSTKQPKKSKKKRKYKLEDSDGVGMEVEGPQPWEVSGNEDICEPIEGEDADDADDGAWHEYATRSKGEVVSAVGIKRHRPPDESTEIRGAVFMVVEEVMQPTPKKPKLVPF